MQKKSKVARIALFVTVTRVSVQMAVAAVVNVTGVPNFIVRVWMGPTLWFVAGIVATHFVVGKRTLWPFITNPLNR